MVGDWAVIGAFTGVHQFCRIGRHPSSAAMAWSRRMCCRIPPGEREIHVFGTNRTGLDAAVSGAACRGLAEGFPFALRAGLNTSQAVRRIRARIEPRELDELPRSSPLPNGFVMMRYGSCGNGPLVLALEMHTSWSK
jgi:UDP-N-acetylglucosamine acyltransferase